MFITTVSSMIYKTVTVNMKQDTLFFYVCVYWGWNVGFCVLIQIDLLN